MSLVVFSHANSYPASTYGLLFEQLRARGFTVRAVEMYGHDPAYPVTDNWPQLVRQLFDRLCDFDVHSQTLLPALAMQASGAGIAMCLAASAVALLALAMAPLPRQTASQPGASTATLTEADWRALEEATAAPLVWWPGLPGWLAAALLLATCWHAVDVFSGLD